MGIAGVRCEGQRAIAAKAVIEFDHHRFDRETGGVDEGEEALAGPAAAAWLELERAPFETDLGVGAEAAWIAQAKAQFGAPQIKPAGSTP